MPIYVNSACVQKYSIPRSLAWIWISHLLLVLRWDKGHFFSSVYGWLTHYCLRFVYNNILFTGWQSWRQIFSTLLLLRWNDLHGSKELRTCAVFLWGSYYNTSPRYVTYYAGVIQKIHLGVVDSTRNSKSNWFFIGQAILPVLTFLILADHTVSQIQFVASYIPIYETTEPCILWIS